MNKLSNLKSFSIPVILTSSAVFDYSRRLTRDQELNSIKQIPTLFALYEKDTESFFALFTKKKKKWNNFY